MYAARKSWHLGINQMPMIPETDDPVPGCYMTHTVKEWQREEQTEENHGCKVFTFSVQYLISVSS